MKSLVLLLFCIFGDAFCYDQSIAIEGSILCHGKPYHGAKVLLMERDSFNSDDVLDEVYSSRNGSYKLNGGENEFYQIDPYLKIVHMCKLDQQEPACEKILEIPIPFEAISDGKEINEHFKIRNIELTTKRRFEWIDC